MVSAPTASSFRVGPSAVGTSRAATSAAAVERAALASQVAVVSEAAVTLEVAVEVAVGTGVADTAAAGGGNARRPSSRLTSKR